MGLRKKRRTPIFWETSLGIPLRTGFIGRFVSRARKNGCWFGFDFHSPWHIGNKNDNAFIVQNSIEKLPRLNRFGKLLEESMTGDLEQERRLFYVAVTRAIERLYITSYKNPFGSSDNSIVEKGFVAEMPELFDKRSE